MVQEQAPAVPAIPAVRPRNGRRRRSGPAAFLRDLIVIVLIAVVASFLIKTFLVRSFYIPSASMENTLLGDERGHDRILVNELVPGLVPLQRGDVVVFKDPGGWLTDQPDPVAQPPIVAGAQWLLSLVGLSTEDSNDHLIKRVIGLPGDHVACCNALGQMTVNGTPLAEPYIRTDPGSAAASKDPFSVTVPKTGLWVMGDNRPNSSDSRFHLDTPTKGFVPVSDVVGRAFVISWPVTRWSVLSNYPDTFGGVPAPK